MDYEKAYKDALERAKYWANNPTVWSSDDICQKLFPKIVEKKDESIKSCIGMCLTDVDNQRFEDYDTSLKDCLAWLEKQGEKNNIVEQLTAFAQHLQKRGAFRDDLCMDIEHEAQSFIEFQKFTSKTK